MCLCSTKSEEKWKKVDWIVSIASNIVGLLFGVNFTISKKFCVCVCVCMPQLHICYRWLENPCQSKLEITLATDQNRIVFKSFTEYRKEYHSHTIATDKTASTVTTNWRTASSSFLFLILFVTNCICCTAFERTSKYIGVYWKCLCVQTETINLLLFS